MIEALALSYAWSFSDPCGWYISNLLYWDDVIIPTLNTQLEDQVLRFA